jgi:hypothetical protein
VPLSPAFQPVITEAEERLTSPAAPSHEILATASMRVSTLW